jgi:hypothetical protein
MNAAWRNLILLSFLIILGVSGGFYLRNRNVSYQKIDRERFISTYAELLAAKAFLHDCGDSISDSAVWKRQNEIYSKSGTDSIWIRRYLESQTADIRSLEEVWGKIMIKADSILAETKRQKANNP